MTDVPAPKYMAVMYRLYGGSKQLAVIPRSKVPGEAEQRIRERHNISSMLYEQVEANGIKVRMPIVHIVAWEEVPQ